MSEKLHDFTYFTFYLLFQKYNLTAKFAQHPSVMASKIN